MIHPTSQPGRSRKSTVHPVLKRVIKIDTGKRHQATRKLSRRIANAGYKVPHAMPRYLCENLRMRKLKKKSPKFTEKTAFWLPGLRTGTNKLVHEKLAVGPVIEQVAERAVPPVKPPERPRVGGQLLRRAGRPHSQGRRHEVSTEGTDSDWGDRFR